jgi:5-methylcytosine-specific restriction endonuclease McrA
MPKKTVSCNNCGAEIERWPSHISDRNYCSVQCRKEAAPRATGKDHGNYNSVEVACANCGETLEPSKSRVEKFERQFCGSDCKAEWQSENWSGEGHHQSNRETVRCSWCGSPLSRAKFRLELNNRHFCDQECKGDWWSANIAEEQHPNWRGGYDGKYGPSWTTQRRAARARDGYRCWLCDVTDKLSRGFASAELSVHHVTPFSEFDDHREANRLGNLLTVCNICHHRVFR